MPIVIGSGAAACAPGPFIPTPPCAPPLLTRTDLTCDPQGSGDITFDVTFDAPVTFAATDVVTVVGGGWVPAVSQPAPNVARVTFPAGGLQGALAEVTIGSGLTRASDGCAYTGSVHAFALFCPSA